MYEKLHTVIMYRVRVTLTLTLLAVEGHMLYGTGHTAQLYAQCCL